MMNRPKRERQLVLIFVASLAIIGLGCPAPPPSKTLVTRPIVLMILADVTTSLEKGEVDRVAALTADVLDKFPDNTDYMIYPIQWETERPTAIDEQHPSPDSQTNLSDDDKSSRRSRLLKKITEYYKNVNNRQPVDRTCILNTLDVADKHFSQTIQKYRTDKAPCMELVIVSDMIEQCSINALNTQIDLRGAPISDAINIVQNMQMPNLSRLHVSIIIPTAEDSTPYAQKRPRVGDLERFWRVVFEHSGFKAEEVRNFNWLPTLPGRFDRVCE